jgi:hypothetical protein
MKLLLLLLLLLLLECSHQTVAGVCDVCVGKTPAFHFCTAPTMKHTTHPTTPPHLQINTPTHHHNNTAQRTLETCPEPAAAWAVH